MKTIHTLFLTLVFSLAGPVVKAQINDDFRNSDDEIHTLIDNSNHIGGYGAFGMRYTSIDSRDAFMFTGRGGIVLGHGVSFGITGTGFISESRYDARIGDNTNIAGGYGGIYIEPIILPKFPVHLAFPITLGAGGIGYSINRYDSNNNWDTNWQDNWVDSRAFVIAEPGVEVEFNVTRFFRFAIGASYKFTSNIDIRYNDNSQIIPRDALNGATVGVTFKFGSF